MFFRRASKKTNGLVSPTKEPGPVSPTEEPGPQSPGPEKNEKKKKKKKKKKEQNDNTSKTKGKEGGTTKKGKKAFSKAASSTSVLSSAPKTKTKKGNKTKTDAKGKKKKNKKKKEDITSEPVIKEDEAFVDQDQPVKHFDDFDKDQPQMNVTGGGNSKQDDILDKRQGESETEPLTPPAMDSISGKEDQSMKDDIDILQDSNIIDMGPPIGEILATRTDDDDVSEIGEAIIEDPNQEVIDGVEIIYNPDDTDICFDDRGHPGTKDWFVVVRECLEKFKGQEYSPPVYKAIKKKLKGRRFLVRTRRNERTSWREATKVEIIALFGDCFNEERRRIEEGIKDDASDVDSSLQNSAIQSEDSLSVRDMMDEHIQPITIDPHLQPLTKGKESRTPMSAPTPRTTNITGFEDSNPDSVDISLQSLEERSQNSSDSMGRGRHSNEEGYKQFLLLAMQEIDAVEDYAKPFNRPGLFEQGVAAEEKIDMLLGLMTKSSRTAALQLELEKLEELVRAIKYASLAPLSDILTKLERHVGDYVRSLSDFHQSSSSLRESSAHLQNVRGAKPSKKSLPQNHLTGKQLDDTGHSNSHSNSHAARHRRTIQVNSDHGKPTGKYDDRQHIDATRDDRHSRDSANEDSHGLNNSGFSFGVANTQQLIQGASYRKEKLRDYDDDQDKQKALVISQPLNSEDDESSFTGIDDESSDDQGDNDLQDSYEEQPLAGSDDEENRQSLRLSALPIPPRTNRRNGQNEGSYRTADFGGSYREEALGGSYLSNESSSEGEEDNYIDQDHGYDDGQSKEYEEAYLNDEDYDEDDNYHDDDYDDQIENLDPSGDGEYSLKDEGIRDPSVTASKSSVAGSKSTVGGAVLELPGSVSEDLSSVGDSMPGTYGSEEGDYDDDDFEEDADDDHSEETASSVSSSESEEEPHQDREDVPNPKLEQFFDRLKHLFEVRRKVEERADMMDPSLKFRHLKVKLHSGGLRKKNGKYKKEYQQHGMDDTIVRNLDDLYEAAEPAAEALKKTLHQMITDLKGFDLRSIEIAPLKARDRAYEKAQQEYSDRPDPPESWLFDIVRGGIICKTYKQMAEVNKWLGKNCLIVASKNRFAEPGFNGYRDLLYHVSIPYQDDLAHICEIQVHHKDLKALDVQYGMPKHYVFFRSIFAGSSRTEAQVLGDLSMLNKYGEIGGQCMVKLLKSKDPNQLTLFAKLCREQLDEFDRALELYRKILIMQEDTDGGNSVDVASTYLSIGLVLGRLGDINESLLNLETALAIQESNLGSDHISVASTYSEIGKMLSLKGDHAGAIKQYQAALYIREHKLGREHFLVISSLKDIGLALQDKGDFRQSEKELRRALKIQEAILGDIHPDVATTRSMIGMTLCKFGDFSQAMEEHRLALSIRETSMGKNHPMTAESHTNIGIVLCNKGDYEVAEWRHRKALRIREAIKGKDDEECAVSLSHLGEVLTKKGDYDSAIKELKRASKIRKHNLGMDHPITAGSYLDLGQVYLKKGKLDQALNEFRRAKVIRESFLGPVHPETAVAYNAIGHVMMLQGDHTAALMEHERALNVFESVLGKAHPLTATAYQYLADTFFANGDKDEALIENRKALALRANVLAKDHPDTAVSCSRIGQLLADKGDLVGALVAYRQALAITVGLCGEDHPDAATAHLRVGSVLATQKEFQAAMKELAQSLRVREAIFGKEHAEVARAQGLIGTVHSMQGNFSKAKEAHKKCLALLEKKLGKRSAETKLARQRLKMAIGSKKEVAVILPEIY